MALGSWACTVCTCMYYVRSAVNAMSASITSAGVRVSSPASHVSLALFTPLFVADGFKRPARAM